MDNKKRSYRILIIIFSILLISSVSASAILAHRSNRNHTSAEITTEADIMPISPTSSETDIIDDNTSEGLTLLNNKEALDANSNAWYVNNEVIDSMIYPDIKIVGNYLVAYYIQYSDTDSGFIDINVISLVDGSTIANTKTACGSYVRVQTNISQIALCDIYSGHITIYDTSLNKTDEYTLSDGYSDYCLSTDMTKLYGIDYSGNVDCIYLPTGEVTPLPLEGFNLYLSDVTDSSALLCYVDKTTQLNCNILLDLDTGELAEPPVNNSIYYCRHENGSWLTASDTLTDYHLYTFTDSNNRRSLIEWNGNSLDLSHNGSKFIGTDMYNSTLSLYDTSGNFLSKVCLSQPAHIGSQVVWSNMWNGYFFISYDSDISETGRLSFWDPNIPVSGTDLNIKAVESSDNRYDDSGLYARVRDIGDRYGIDIKIMDQCQLDYDIYYSSDVYTDSDGINAFLDMLDLCLSKYPDGFFRQLRYGNIQRIQIELVQNLTPKEGSGVGSSAAAFTQEQSDYYLMVCDAYYASPSTIYHEIAHIIDNRLAWDASLRNDALFNEETWSSLNPEGFSYTYSYDDWSSNVISPEAAGYFEYEYSLTFPTEDRATMMEAAMSGELNDKVYWSGLLKKLEYYSNCIRDCFNTDEWPEKTAWEIY